MEPPQWDGELHVVGDRYSRFYVRRPGVDSVPFASFSDAGSWYTQRNGSVVRTVEFSSFGQAVGNQYRDKVALTNEGRRLVITGNDFKEVWEVR